MLLDNEVCINMIYCLIQLPNGETNGMKMYQTYVSIPIKQCGLMLPAGSCHCGVHQLQLVHLGKSTSAWRSKNQEKIGKASTMYHIISCHVMSCHIISYHIISYHTMITYYYVLLCTTMYYYCFSYFDRCC